MISNDGWFSDSMMSNDGCRRRWLMMFELTMLNGQRNRSACKGRIVVNRLRFILRFREGCSTRTILRDLSAVLRMLAILGTSWALRCNLKGDFTRFANARLWKSRCGLNLHPHVDLLTNTDLPRPVADQNWKRLKITKLEIVERGINIACVCEYTLMLYDLVIFL